MSKSKNKLLTLFAIMPLAIFFAVLYWNGAKMQLMWINTNMGATDQSAYMEFAWRMYESGYTYLGGYNRTPFYPFLQSLFYHPGLSDELFFEQGKYRNLFLSYGILFSLFFIFRHYFSWLQAFTLTAITAFTIFIFKAGFFQTELLYYFINFILFSLMWRLIQQLSWRFAILTGIVAGLAHLTKASVLPGLLLFIALAMIKWTWVLYQERKASNVNNEEYLSWTQLLMIPLVGILFLMVISPYIVNSKRVFGHYFYNVNSTFYMWYDSWEEATAGTKAHGDRVGWPDMPSEDIPSMGKYLQEHTTTQIITRFLRGGWDMFADAGTSYGYAKYVLLYLFICALAIYRFRDRAYLTVKENSFLSLFLVLYFAGYLTLYAWYYPIVKGNRLILSQFLPFMFTLAMGLSILLRTSYVRIKRYSILEINVVHLFLLLMLTVDIHYVLLDRVATMYGGN